MGRQLFPPLSSALGLAGFEEGPRQPRPVDEGHLDFRVQVTGFATGIDVAVPAALEAPVPADPQVPGDRVAVAARDLRDLRFGPVAVGAVVDLLDNDRHDEGGGRRHMV
jgi:hypothetical protein